MAFFFVPSVSHAQQCLGRPTQSGEQAVAARVDLDRLAFLAGEYSGVSRRLAWNGFVGAAADELIPPGDFDPVFGGGFAYTGAHRAICPTASVWTTSRESEFFSERPGDSSRRWTTASLGVAVGRRFGEDRFHGAAFLLPYLRLVREDRKFGGHDSDDTRHEWWVEGGFSLRGERLWGRATVGLQVGNYFPTEEVLDGSLGFSAGMAF